MVPTLRQEWMFEMEVKNCLVKEGEWEIQQKCIKLTEIEQQQKRIKLRNWMLGVKEAQSIKNERRVWCAVLISNGGAIVTSETWPRSEQVPSVDDWHEV